MGKKKNNKGMTGRQPTVGAEYADDDFDGMLAEFQIADVTTATPNTGSTTTPTSSLAAGSSSGSSSSASTAEITVTEEAIIVACKSGNVSKLRQWGRRGVRVTSAMPLCHAAYLGKLDVMRCLLEKLGADVHQLDRNGATALLFATHAGDNSIMRFLVKELGADAKHLRFDGCTALLFAAQNGNLKMMRYLVKELDANVNQTGRGGATPFFLIAAQEDNLDTLRCLVKKLGANVNQAKHDGTTPLYIAAQIGHVDVVRCQGTLRRRQPSTARWDHALVHSSPDGPLECCSMPGERAWGRHQSSKAQRLDPSNDSLLPQARCTVKWLVKAGADPTLSSM
jgi:hypothetical protein